MRFVVTRANDAVKEAVGHHICSEMASEVDLSEMRAKFQVLLTVRVSLDHLVLTRWHAYLSPTGAWHRPERAGVGGSVPTSHCGLMCKLMINWVSLARVTTHLIVTCERRRLVMISRKIRKASYNISRWSFVSVDQKTQMSKSENMQEETTKTNI